MSDERLAPVDLTVDERGDVSVTPELPQQRGGVPQDEEGFVGPVELGVTGIERSPLRGAALRCPAGQLGGLPHLGSGRVVTEQPAQGSVDGPEPCFDQRRRRGSLPRRGDGARHQTRVEVEERGRHHAGAHRTHRRRT